MIFIAISSALLAISAPAATTQPAKALPAAQASDGDDKADSTDNVKKPEFDMAKVMGMLDKIFPAMPDPPAERLVLARVTAGGMLPSGTYAGLFDDLMSSTLDHVLSLSGADFGAKDKGGKAENSTTLRQEIAKDDPYFEERMRITRRVISEELLKISAVMEPKMREGLARSIARRFDEKQLREINTFLATDSGKAFAGQTMRMWVDPDVMRSMVQTFPHMITAIPGAMARLEAETAHLPKPKKKEEEKNQPQEEAEPEPTT